ncbi:MAG TPA: choice-of-anchor L domain-containing protein, partial [Bacteroidia bacterium]
MKLTPQLISKSNVVVRFVLSALFSTLISLHVTAQGAITVDTTQTPQSLASLITGNGVSISNINVKCKTTNSGKGYGKFTSTVPSLPISEGLIITTGEPRNAIGPNTSGSTSAYYGNNSGSAVASDSITTLMYQFSQRTVYEYCMIEFDIVPQGDSIIFDYVFASEEYNEWVGSNYNDVFGFFIQGPGIVGNAGLGNKLNLARVNPNNGTTAVAINSVNNSSNNSYYVSNSNAYNDGVSNASHNIGYDGFTKNLYAKTSVKPCSTYRLQLIIADCGDRIYD